MITCSYYPVASMTQKAAKVRKTATPIIVLYEFETLLIAHLIVVPMMTKKMKAKRKSFQDQFHPSTKIFPTSGISRASADQRIVL